jgi:hypothetical protein
MQITKHNIMLPMIHPVLSVPLLNPLQRRGLACLIFKKKSPSPLERYWGEALFLPRQLFNQIRLLCFINRSILAENIMEP